MFDARIFLNNLSAAKKVLSQQKADFKGDYTVIDKIYRSKDPTQTLDKVFLRSRSIPKNIWNQKPFIVVIKNTEIKKVGKLSIIPLKKEFDTEAEGHFTIEFKSKTEEGLRKLLDLFDVKDEQVIKGPSVIAIKKILNK